MTLDELYESFNVKRRAILHGETEEADAWAKLWPYPNPDREWIWAFDPMLTYKEAVDAAKLYVIYRDEGPEAAMLWKLANW